MFRIARPLSVLAATLLVLTACTSPGEADPAPVPEPEETTGSVAPVELAGEGMVQDTWIYERVRAMVSGNIIDVTEDLTSAIAARAASAAPIELMDGVEFFPVEGLDAAINSETGEERNDLDVVLGLVRDGDAEALQIIATPTGPRSVWVDDVLTFDFAALGLESAGLVPGTALIVEYAFGQGIPEPGEQPNLGPERTGAHILAERMASDRFQWFGVEDSGGVVPGMIKVLGTVPGEVTANGQVGDASGTDTDTGAATVTTTGYVAEDGPLITQINNSGANGGIPIKAQPVTGAVGDIGKCKSWGLKCISDYFDRMNKAFEDSLDSLFKKNMSPDPPPTKNPVCDGCSVLDGEPHARTFDERAYDLQLVGEFVAAHTSNTQAEDFEVQVRTAPWSDSDVIAIVSGAAVGVGESRVTFDPLREDPIWIDGEPAPHAEHGSETGVGEATLKVTGRDAIIEYGGSRVFVHGLYSSYLGIRVEPGTATDWTGLFGSPNGDRDDDLTSRDGVVLDRSASASEIYEKFAHTWRVDDSESLFDYGPGETTDTFTDLAFPREILTIKDLPASKVADAIPLCNEAGVTEQPYLMWCVYDFVVTGDVSFVRSAALVQARALATGGEWMAHLAGWSDAGSRALGEDGHVFAPMRQDGETAVFALHPRTGKVVWQEPTGGPACVGVADNGQVVIPVNAGDLGFEIQFLGESDGEVLATAETGITQFNSCDGVLTTGNTVIFRTGTTLYAADADSGAFLFSESIEGLAGNPVVSGDGSVWGVVNSDGAHIARIDPVTGTAQLTAVNVDKLESNATATADGLVVAYSDGDDYGMLRFAGGLEWKTSFEALTESVGFAGKITGQLAVTDQFIAGYSGSSTVGVLDLATGEALRSIKPSSFNNNGSKVFASGEQVVVGPFGGKDWAESYDLATGELAWSTTPLDESPSLEALGYNDAKRFGPQIPDGGVIASSSTDDGTLLYKVGAGK